LTDAIVSGALFAIVVVNSRVALSSSATGTSLFTRPIWSASWLLNWRPV
jgi:hypothetical protein